MNPEDKLKYIQEKLENNPNLKDEIEDHINKLGEIFETDIQLTLNINGEIDDYINVLNLYDENEFYDKKSNVKLHQLIDSLNDEDMDFNVAIDPINLKEGINYLSDFLITTINDTIIIVPISNKIKENE